MNQVHKENLTHVENANPGRQGLEIEIFGMEGVPAEIIDQHNQLVMQSHFADEQERARITGNPIRGQYASGQAPPNVRPKVTESLEDLEERAGKFRTDRKNGVPLPVAPEVAPKAVRYSCCVYKLEAQCCILTLPIDSTPPPTRLRPPSPTRLPTSPLPPTKPRAPLSPHKRRPSRELTQLTRRAASSPWLHAERRRPECYPGLA